MLVLINHLEFTTESNSTKLSIIRFWKWISRASDFVKLQISYLIALF